MEMSIRKCISNIERELCITIPSSCYCYSYIMVMELKIPMILLLLSNKVLDIYEENWKLTTY